MICYQFYYVRIQKKKHEILSQLIFKKTLLDNPKVLATFVSSPYQLSKDHVKNIEKMIDPKEVGSYVANDNAINVLNKMELFRTVMYVCMYV